MVFRFAAIFSKILGATEFLAAKGADALEDSAIKKDDPKLVEFLRKVSGNPAILEAVSAENPGLVSKGGGEKLLSTTKKLAFAADGTRVMDYAEFGEWKITAVLPPFRPLCDVIVVLPPSLQKPSRFGIYVTQKRKARWSFAGFGELSAVVEKVLALND